MPLVMDPRDGVCGPLIDNRFFRLNDGVTPIQGNSKIPAEPKTPQGFFYFSI